MASLNQATLIGHVGKDPELRTFPDGGQVCSVSLATTEKWTDKQTGELQEATEWHRLVFNGRQAEVASRYLKKGSQCYVQGGLRHRKWTDKDGIERTTTEIRVDNLKLLGAPASNAAPARGQQSAYQQAPAAPARGEQSTYQQTPAAPAAHGFADMDDDIPF